ncbi:MAG: methyl-accepting chemotaxis protein, partial [Clostridiales bacterium]|nr:methyl-accepting chemotaxis protein [Clostridiales bacterium]
HTVMSDRGVPLRGLIFLELFLVFFIPYALILGVIGVYTFEKSRQENQDRVKMYTSMLTNEMEERLERYQKVVELAATRPEVESLDYTQAEPYLQELIAKEGKEEWSHFIITNQNGTEQAHSEGKGGHGYSLRFDTCFVTPWEKEETYISEPTISKDTGREVMGISTPIYRDGKKLGVFIGYIWLESISNTLNDFPYTDSSYAFLINQDGTISAHPDKQKILNEVWDSTKESNGYQYSYLQLPGTTLTLCVVSPDKETYSLVYAVSKMIVAGFVIMVLCSIIGAIRISNRTTNLIGYVVGNLQKLANGITTLENKKVAYHKAREIQKLKKESFLLADTLKQIMNQLETQAAKLQSVVHGLSEGIIQSDENIQEVAKNASDFAASMEEIQATCENLKNHSQIDTKAAEVIVLEAKKGDETSTDMLRRAEVSIQEIKKARKDAASMMEQMERALKISMEESKKTKDIQKLTKQILDITEQTNLLSLNASIEAARANEAGRGFSVVAEQMGVLANDCRSTANDIQSISTTVVEAVSSLESDASHLLHYVREALTDAYDKFEAIASGYHKDAEMIEDTMAAFSWKANELKDSFGENEENIIQIVEIMEKERKGVEEIAENAMLLSGHMTQVSNESGGCKQIANELYQQVAAFYKDKKDGAPSYAQNGGSL